MQLARAVMLFVWQALWRGLGLQWAGRALIAALESPVANLRVLAGMFLVRGGSRGIPLLREALSRRRGLPIALQIIADIGATELLPDVERFAHDPDEPIATAARQALRQLSAKSPPSPELPP